MSVCVDCGAWLSDYGREIDCFETGEPHRTHIHDDRCDGCCP